MMPYRFRTTMGLALAGLLWLAPGEGIPAWRFGMTAGTAGEIVATGATVEGIDHSTGVLTLRAVDGERLELKLAQARLAGLQAGDRVQVTIQKVPGPPGRSPPGSVEPPPSEPTR